MVINYLKLFQKNVAQRLEKLERRPAWLAEKSGLTKSQIGRILNEENNPSLDSVIKIANGLNEHPAAFLLNIKGPNKALNDLLLILPSLQDSELGALLRSAETMPSLLRRKPASTTGTD